MSFLAASGTAISVGLVLWAMSGRPTVVGGNPWPEEARTEIGRARFWLASVSVGLAAFLVLLALTGLPIVAAVPATVVATLPRAFNVRRRARQVALVQEAWPDALRDLVSSVRAGASLQSAIAELGTQGPEALRESFGSFSIYSRSLGVVPTLEMIKADLGDPTSDRVIEVLILAHRRGGNVVPEILTDLAEATTRDIWTMEQVRSEALEQKINSRVVFILPWLVLIVMTLRSGAFREFYSTRLGVLIVLVCGVMSLVGVAIASRLGSQPDEPRVFVGGRP